LATIVDPRAVVIEEPERPVVRHPSDLLRLIIALVFTALGFLLATTLNNLSEAITIEVIEGFDTFPNPVVVVLILGVGLLSLFLPIGILAYLVVKRYWRRLALGVLASAIAIGLLIGIEEFLVTRFASPEIDFIPPSWICHPGLPFDFGLSCVPGDAGGASSLIGITGFVAFFATVAPRMSRRWRRFTWITILVLAVGRMIDSLAPPIDEFLAIGIAYAIGAAVVLIAGEPDRRPRGRHVVTALGRSGIELAELKRAGVDARGSTPYFAVQADGDRLFVKVLSPEERAADILFRIMRMFRLKGVGDERPFSSLKRGVEHEAVAALKASADGVRTPRLVAVSEVEPNSMLLAYEMIEGRSLDKVPPEQLTDEILQEIWAKVATLRQRRTAHRDLRLANVFLGSDGEPWLIDFGFAELAATDGQLRSDVAELTMSTATVIGAERAVANAVAGIGPEAVADAASRIQPLALSGATREAVKKQKGLDQQVRNEIQRRTGVEQVELEDLERVKSRTVLMIVGFALAMYFLIPQLTQVDFGAVLDANWAWAPVILAASFFTYVGAAYNVMGSVPDPIPLVPTVYTQFAGSFINRISPVKVGGMATNVRYLQRNGVEVSVAVAGIGIGTVSTMAVHMTLLVLSIVFLGQNADDFIKLPSGSTLLYVLVGVFTVAAVVGFLPAGRRLFKNKLWPALKKSGQGLAQIASRPAKALMLFGGALVMITSYIAALWFSLEAFGGGLGIVSVALVFLGGQALGNMAPTPGGIGATEAALIAAMTVLGLDSTTAVAATFLYRIATFWLPVLPGVLALRRLEARDLL
jgi:undecaprenyl-diphosphatase